MKEKSALPEDWHKFLGSEFDKEYMKELSKFLKSELGEQKTIYPKMNQIFSAFQETRFQDVKVVILGQDPYHGPQQAHGLAFSVQRGVRTPPSLQNIYKELRDDMSCKIPSHGNLEHWAKQGVLLLNNVLTVEEKKAASHQNKGWEDFTRKVIEVLNEEQKNLVFLLWGSPAQKKASFVDQKKHLVLKSVHPSPLSAHRGFFGSKPFSKANAFLKKVGKPEIHWQIPD